MKKIFITLSILLLISTIVIISFRVRKDLSKKLNFANTYAIQNIKTGNAIRVHNAEIEDGTEIISYGIHNWECITWEFIQLEDSTFLLKNLYTQKTFQPKSALASGVGLIQQSLGGTELQYWELLKQPDGTFLIRLKNSQLYITVTSDKEDSPIVLMHKQNSSTQQWKLLRQNPWI